MPDAPKPTNIALARLAALPRRNGLVITGGKRPLNIYIREGNETVQPQVALWLDAASGFVFCTKVINPAESADNGVREALDALVETMIAPITVGASDESAPPEDNGKRRTHREEQALPHLGLPARITVNDAEMAETALAPLDIPVEYDAFTRLRSGIRRARQIHGRAARWRAARTVRVGDRSGATPATLQGRQWVCAARPLAVHARSPGDCPYPRRAWAGTGRGNPVRLRPRRRRNGARCRVLLLPR